MNKERSAALIHSYLDDRSGKDKPDRLTRLGILSAIELYKHGEIDTVCVTVKNHLNDQIVQHLEYKVGSIPKEDIFVKPEAVTTLQELTEFKKIAGEQNITKLISIADKVHVPRTRRLSNKVFGQEQNIQVFSSKEVLSRYSRFDNVLKESDSWPERIALRRKEKIIRVLSKIPLLGNEIERKGPELFPGKLKIAFDQWVIRRLAK